MKPAGFLLFSLLAVSANAARPVLIEGANIHTQTDRGVITAGKVLVGDGRILALGREIPLEKIPDNTQVLVLNDRVITPGLFAPYTQLGLTEIDLESTTVDANLDATGIGPAFDVQYGFNPKSTAVAVNVAEGVMYGVLAPQANPDILTGRGAVADYRRGTIIMPHAAMFGSITAAAANKVGGSRAEAIGRLRRNFASLGKARGKNYIPGPGEYSRWAFAALRKHTDSKRPFVIEAHRAAEIRQLIVLAREYELDLVIRGASEAWQIADDLARSQVAVIIDPLQNLPLNFERLGARLDNAAILHHAGVQVAITVSDLHNTRLLRQHAGNAVSYGLPWQAGLAAITRIPAEIFGTPELGRLKVGGAASFVIWSGDPLEVTTYPTHILAHGEWQSMKSRQTRLFHRYRSLQQDNFKYRF
ncbi:MAG: amidohydrolase family protein [Pseudomonadota bacterium]|nr:amidohydrolase family protein [Pseudomonadota bacterium]